MTRRLLTALIAMIAGVASFPAAAPAFVLITFTTEPGVPARVEAFGLEQGPLRVEVMRRGAVIAAGDGVAELPRLEPGDTARTDVLSAVYDGTPAFGDVCFGSTSLTVTRPPEGFSLDAGVRVLADETAPPIEATTSDDAPAVVTLSRPLAPGDEATASAVGAIDGGVVGISQAVGARDCSTPEPTDGVPAPGTPRGETAGRLSGALAAARLKRLGLARLGHARTHALPVVFTQPGTVRLKLQARGKVIGTGTKTAGSGEHRVTVALTAAGRRLLRHSKRLKLTLTATLTPSRAGGAPQRASVSVTLRR